MKKLKQVFGKRVFEKRSGKEGSPRPPAFRGATFGEFLDVFISRFFTAGAHSPRPRPGRSGHFPVSPAAPKFFGRAARRESPQSGRSMIEMLGVLAIIGVLSITALVGFTYAMNKHRANETIYDVMLRGTNVPMVDENYASKPSGHVFRFPDLPAGTYYPMVTQKDDGSSYYVEATGVTYRVCELILKMNPTDIDQIVVGDAVYVGDSDICGTTDGLAMKFCFGSDGTICDGTGHDSSGGSGSGSGSGGSGTDPDPDACDGIDCGIHGSCDNGVCDCTDGYSGIDCSMPPECQTDSDCPATDICSDGRCVAKNCLTGGECGDGGCCQDGVCSSDCKPDDCCDDEGICDPSCMCLTCEQAFSSSKCICTNGGCAEDEECVTSCQTDDNGCVLGFSCTCELPPAGGCELGQHTCFGSTASEQWCCNAGQKCGETAEECLSCGDLSDIYCFSSITDDSEYTCTSDKEAACTACGYDFIVGTERYAEFYDVDDFVYVCGGQNSCRSGYTWKRESYYRGYMSSFACVKDSAAKCCDYDNDGGLTKWNYEESGCNPSTAEDGWRYSIPCD